MHPAIDIAEHTRSIMTMARSCPSDSPPAMTCSGRLLDASAGGAVIETLC
jgi:hypothetical protein